MNFIVALLATYGLSVILVEADGPFGGIYKLRSSSYLGALSCLMCISLWVGAIVALILAHSIPEWFVYSLALSGGTIIIDRALA